MGNGLWSRAFDPERDLPELKGKVMIVTGANTGIGYATAKQLARKGAKVYVGSRSEERGKDAIAKLTKEGVGSGEVIFLHVDLSTPQLAKQAAEKFFELEDRLDVLVNNAAMMWDAHLENKTAIDGITQMMMTNHICVVQFTKTLLPLLQKTAAQPKSDVRIVVVSSRGHSALSASDPKISFTMSLFQNHYNDTMIPTLSRYCVTKLANTLYANKLARELSADGILCISLHPGFVNTSLSTRFSFSSLVYALMTVTAKAPDEGAYASCFAAGATVVREQAEKYNGSYLVPPGQMAKPSGNALRVELQDELWETTEKYLSEENL